MVLLQSLSGQTQFKSRLSVRHVLGPETALTFMSEQHKATLAESGIQNSVLRALRPLRWLVSFPAMLGSFLVAKLAYELREFRVDPDLWWHIKLGQDIARTHHWPTADPYSYTVHGTPWIAYEWLGDVAIGFVAKFGLQALAALLIALASLIAIALYSYASLSARNAKAGFVAGVFASVFAVGNFNLRPQMFGALFLAVTVICLEYFRRGHSKVLWVFPPLFLVWINTHGSWIVGLGVLAVALFGGLLEFRLGGVEGIRWTEKQRMQLELAVLGSIAVLPLTPYGTRLATYPFMVASSLPLNVAYVQEWFPMPFNITWGKIFLALLACSILTQMLYRLTFRLDQWLLALGGVVMALLHARFVMLFAPFFAPILAGLLSQWLDRYRPEKDKFLLNAALMTAAAVSLVWYFPSQRELERFVEKQFPVRAINYLRTHPAPGPMFNNYGAGGYLVAYFPEQKVFIDGRGDLYELEGVLSDYMQVATIKPAALSVLKFYGIRMCLLERADPIGLVLAERPDWKQVYYDDAHIIFERTDSGGNGTPVSGAQLAYRGGGNEPAD
jgi:hypothetical protein